MSKRRSTHRGENHASAIGSKLVVVQKECAEVGSRHGLADRRCCRRTNVVGLKMKLVHALRSFHRVHKRDATSVSDRIVRHIEVRELKGYLRWDWMFRS